MNKGQKLKKQKIIPGGNQLFSKGLSFFANYVYYKRAKGCEIWDMENNKYLILPG